MSAAGLDDTTIQLITEMREQWVCGAMWGMHGLHKLASEEKGVFATQSPARSIVDKYLEHWPKITGWFALRNAPPFPCAKWPGAIGWGISTPTTGRLQAEEKMRLEAQVKRFKEKELQIAMKLIEEKEAAEAKRKEDQEMAEKQKEAAEREAAEAAQKEAAALQQKVAIKGKKGLAKSRAEERRRKLEEEERRKEELKERVMEENREEGLKKEKEEREWAECLEEQEKAKMTK
ncbi:hypothetical protein BJ165DRAFT_1000492 [Panaeolus papilionaceus]|nr:hypothetical protein BJ165DRAFT_1000492 [Panaeolus papilionaceus]